MTAPAWAGSYVGLQWKANGTDHGGVNCWTLVRLVLAEQCGLDLPTYDDTPVEKTLAIADKIGAEIKCWRDVTGRQRMAFDVAVMADRVGHGPAAHVALFVSPTDLLHIEIDRAAHIVPFNHWSIRRRIRAIFRHEAFAH